MAERMYTITLSEKQLRVVNDALDMYSRMGMGQLEVAVEEFLRTYFFKRYHEVPEAVPNPDKTESRKRECPSDEDWVTTTRGRLVKALIDRVKYLVFGHPPNGSWGTHNEKVPWRSREAYDIKQVTRKAIAEARMADPDVPEKSKRHIKYTVDMGMYLATNPDLPPVKCALVTED